MKAYRHLIPALVAALALAASPAGAVTVTGGIDPLVGLSTMLPWALRVAGFVISGIAIARGAAASYEGRSIMPALAGVIGGTALAFGTPYLLTAYGVL